MSDMNDGLGFEPPTSCLQSGFMYNIYAETIVLTHWSFKNKLLKKLSHHVLIDYIFSAHEILKMPFLRKELLVYIEENEFKLQQCRLPTREGPRPYTTPTLR